MRDDDDDVRELDEVFLEPGDRLEVEAVRRLVEEEHVGVAEDGLGEEDAHLDALVDLAHELLVVGSPATPSPERRTAAWASASQPPSSANSASSSAARMPSASLKSAFS